MPVPVSDILDKVRRVLNDEREPYRWSDDELIGWINDGAGAIVVIRPAAGSKTDTIDLVEGVYQELPDGGLQVLDVVRNIKSDDTPGRAVQRTDRQLLDSLEPDWYSRKQVDQIRHFMTDDRNPRAFYVYPPVNAGGKVEVLYSAQPDKVSAPGDSLDLDRSYVGPLVSYTLYRALAKDSEYANGQVAVAHKQDFDNTLGIRTQTQLVNSPKGALDEAP